MMLGTFGSMAAVTLAAAFPLFVAWAAGTTCKWEVNSEHERVSQLSQLQTLNKWCKERIQQTMMFAYIGVNHPISPAWKNFLIMRWPYVKICTPGKKNRSGFWTCACFYFIFSVARSDPVIFTCAILFGPPWKLKNAKNPGFFPKTMTRMAKKNRCSPFDKMAQPPFATRFCAIHHCECSWRG